MLLWTDQQQKIFTVSNVSMYLSQLSQNSQSKKKLRKMTWLYSGRVLLGSLRNSIRSTCLHKSSLSNFLSDLPPFDSWRQNISLNSCWLILILNFLLHLHCWNNSCSSERSKFHFICIAFSILSFFGPLLVTLSPKGMQVLNNPFQLQFIIL